MGLKTLKDITSIRKKGQVAYSETDVIVYEIRQEAIKWIKHFTQYPLCEKEHNWQDIKVMKIRDFMNFFNITEEELE